MAANAIEVSVTEPKHVGIGFHINNRSAKLIVVPADASTTAGFPDWTCSRICMSTPYGWLRLSGRTSLIHKPFTVALTALG